SARQTSTGPAAEALISGTRIPSSSELHRLSRAPKRRRIRRRNSQEGQGAMSPSRRSRSQIVLVVILVLVIEETLGRGREGGRGGKFEQPAETLTDSIGFMRHS